MRSKWDGQSEKRNLVTALCIIHNLLNTTELNLDDMEDDTRDSIRVAGEFLDEAHAHGYIRINEGRLTLSDN